ncbi:MAG: DUF4160 domain-containing protein [Actinomycetota bacterium]|nr:DUF4160 domain-containing protein [Actinomycetota bacterium]
MPRISSFYGISIYMYLNDHEPAHFHAIYGGAKGRFEIDTLRPMDDDALPPAARRPHPGVGISTPRGTEAELGKGTRVSSRG